MRKLLRSLAVLLLPILLYYVLFLTFEPNNFFGLRRETPTGAVFGALRGYQRSPTPGILLGDSRFANIENMDAFEKTTKLAFTNLAYGGASLKESLDELDYLLGHYDEIESVVFELSFYTLNQNYSADRFGFIEMALYNPFVYLTNLSYNLEAMQNLVYWLEGRTLYGGKAETQNPANYRFQSWQAPGGERVEIREDILAYLESIAGYTQNWQLDAGEDGQFARLLSTIQRCSDAGIRFTVVLPPIHDDVLQYAVKANGIYDQMLPLIDTLKASPAQVLDYEMTGRPPYGEEMWFDGFHLDYERGLPVWAEQLAGDMAKGRGA